MIIGCQMCWGAVWGPVDTTLEAKKPTSDIDAVTPPTPTATMRSLINEKGPTAPPSANLMILIDPVILRISSRPQAPASRSLPSAQARKRARLFENSIGLNGFSAGLRPFRAWALGAAEGAGTWNAPGLPNIEGGFGIYVQNAGVYWSTLLSYGAFRYQIGRGGNIVTDQINQAENPSPQFNASWANSIYGASSTVMPPSVNTPVILYLGKAAQI